MELIRTIKDSRTRINTNEKIVKEAVSLFPKRGIAVVWENKVREHKVWWGDVYIQILSTSLLVSSGIEIKVVKGGKEEEEKDEIIHLNLNPPYSSEYVLPCLLDSSKRPALSVEPERGKWWEEARGLTRVRVQVPYQNPVKVMKNPLPFYPSGSHEAEFKTYPTKPLEVDDHPFWRTVENLVCTGKTWKESEGYGGSEEIGVNGEEIRRFVRNLLQNRGKEYDPRVKHFLILPRHVIYRNGEGKALVVEGGFLANPRDQKWAFGSLGYWTERTEQIRPWSGEKDKQEGERHDHNSLKVIRTRTETPPGWVHATITRISRWTEEWSLVMIPDEIFSGSKGR